MKWTFIIGIDDGDCKYEYPLIITGDVSINDIYKKLCKAYKVEPKEGSYHPSTANVLKRIKQLDII
jgi:predicted extracellular nuclease